MTDEHQLDEEPGASDTLFKNSKTFSLYIENVVIESGMTHMEAVLDYCEKNYIDPEDIAKLLSKSLREKIALNMVDLNYIQKTARLDI